DHRVAALKQVFDFQKAAAGANGGDAEQMCTVSAMLFWGQGTPTNRVSALHWAQKAAAARSSRRMRILSAFYFDGFGGVPQDCAKGLLLLRDAAERGDTVAMCHLANFYESGDYGVHTNTA